MGGCPVPLRLGSLLRLAELELLVDLPELHQLPQWQCQVRFFLQHVSVVKTAETCRVDMSFLIHFCLSSIHFFRNMRWWKTHVESWVSPMGWCLGSPGSCVETVESESGQTAVSVTLQRDFVPKEAWSNVSLECNGHEIQLKDEWVVGFHGNLHGFFSMDFSYWSCLAVSNLSMPFKRSRLQA